MKKTSTGLEDNPAESQGQEEPWAERFKWLLHTQHAGNQSSLAKALGVVPTQVANLLAGAIPRGDTLREAVRSHPGINPEWLLTGNGPREKPPPPDVSQRTLQDIEALIARARARARAISTVEGVRPDDADLLSRADEDSIGEGGRAE